MLDARGKLSQSKLAQHRLKMHIFKGALGVVAVVAFFGGLSWLSFSDALSVQRVVIEGNTSIKTRALQTSVMLATAPAKALFFSQQNTLLYPRAELEQRLAFEFPTVKTISVRTQPMQHQATVAITERQRYALWCGDSGNCYTIDDDGFVFEKTNDAPNILHFRGGVAASRTNPIRSSVAPEYFLDARNIVDNLYALGLTVETFTFEGEDARVTIAPGWELLIALEKDAGATLANLTAVLDEHDLRSQLDNINYIDMRFDERVYYKLRNDE